MRIGIQKTNSLLEADFIGIKFQIKSRQIDFRYTLLQDLKDLQGQ